VLPTGPDAIQSVGYASDSLEIELRLRKRLSRRHIRDSVGGPGISSRGGSVQEIGQFLDKREITSYASATSSLNEIHSSVEYW